MGERVTICHPPLDDRTLTLAHGELESRDRIHPWIPKLEESVFHLNRENLKLACETLFSTTTKVFSGLNILNSLTFRSGQWINSIRRMDLFLSHFNLITAFSIPFPPFNTESYRDTHDHPTMDLDKLPNLKSLTITFMSTVIQWKGPWSIGSWDWYFAVPGFDRWRYPCQRRLVEWIMPFPFPQICKIPYVHLSGYVKTPTKVFWERLLRDAEQYAELLNERQRMVRAMPWNAFPPCCNCRHPCAFEGVDYQWSPAINRNHMNVTPQEIMTFEDYKFDYEDDDVEAAEHGYKDVFDYEEKIVEELPWQ